MRYPASETAARHEKILAAGARLFRERGFDGVNVAEVMKAAGLTHGGFYAHFASKEALCAAASSHALDEMQAHVEKALEAPSPWPEFVDQYLGAAHRDHPGQGCMLAALGPELARQSPAFRAQSTTILRRLFEHMAAFFAPRRGVAPSSQAIASFSTLLGAIILARAVDDPDLSLEILEAARAAQRVLGTARVVIDE